MNVLNKNVQAGKNFEKIICVSGGETSIRHRRISF